MKILILRFVERIALPVLVDYCHVSSKLSREAAYSNVGNDHFSIFNLVSLGCYWSLSPNLSSSRLKGMKRKRRKTAHYSSEGIQSWLLTLNVCALFFHVACEDSYALKFNPLNFPTSKLLGLNKELQLSVFHFNPPVLNLTHGHFAIFNLVSL